MEFVLMFHLLIKYKLLNRNPMQNLRIQKPCSEKWNLMNATEKGAYCQKCATEVIDFTAKSPNEIKSVIKSLGGATFCSRISTQQLNQLNLEYEEWEKMNSSSYFQSKFLFSMLLIFGLSLFSCETEEGRQKVEKIQQVATKIIPKLKVEIKDLKIEEIQSRISSDTVINSVDSISDSNYIDNEIEELVEPPLIHEGFYSMGDMAMSRSYISYLTTIEEPIEYDENGVKIPTSFETKVYPNPSVVASTLEIGFPLKDNFDIQLFDMNGKLLQKIYQGELEKGTHRFPVEVSDYISGMYLIVISSEKYKETVRLMKQ
jgi:hypothetical protein